MLEVPQKEQAVKVQMKYFNNNSSMNYSAESKLFRTQKAKSLEIQITNNAKKPSGVWSNKECDICGTNYHRTIDCDYLECYKCGGRHFATNCKVWRQDN